jgi:hypothetical protein
MHGLKFFAACALALALSTQVFGAASVTNDPSITFAESQRTAVNSNLFSVDVSFPGKASFASNSTFTLGFTLPDTAGAVSLYSNVALRGVTVPAAGGPVALGTNVAGTGMVLNSPSFPLTGGSATLGTNIILSGVTIPATGGPINMGTNVIHTGSFSGTIDATSKCTVVNGVITAQGI